MQGSGDNTFDTLYAASGITLGYLKLFYFTYQVAGKFIILPGRIKLVIFFMDLYAFNIPLGGI